MTQLFHYVGPYEIRSRMLGRPEGLRIAIEEDLIAWENTAEAKAENGWATYVISNQGDILIASRRSEHVACAGGNAVRCAGELCVTSEGEVVEVSNHSTGYCPREDTWEVVRESFDRAGIKHPASFTFTVVFRRCNSCGQRNVVKCGWFECGVCGNELPKVWNFDVYGSSNQQEC